MSFVVFLELFVFVFPVRPVTSTTNDHDFSATLLIASMIS